MANSKRYIVEFYDTPDESIIKSVGGIVRYNFKSVEKKISAILSDEAVKLLQQNNLIKNIAEVKKGTGGGQYFDWGYTLTKVDTIYRGVYSGRGIKVAILDTGLAYHEDLPTATVFKDFINGQTTQYDDYDHGSFIAGIIAGKNNNIGPVGVAPDVQLYIGKVLDSENRGYVDDFVAGIDWAISQGVDIINFSIYTDEWWEQDVVDACRRAYNTGIIVVACSGNGYINDDVARSQVCCPACDYSCVGVGSINKDKVRSSFSNYGDGLDLVAPGENVCGAVPGYGYDYYAYWSGTSFATAYVTGHLAILKEIYPYYSRSQLVSKLLENCMPLGASSEYGAGCVCAKGNEDIAPLLPSSPVVCNERVEGGLSLSWGSSSGADYYRLYYTWDNGTQASYKDIYATSYTLTGLQYGKTYSFKVKGCNSAGSSDYTSAQYVTTAPQTPTISVGTVVNNSVNIMTGSISGNYDKIRIYRQDNTGGYLECDANSYVTFTGLTAGNTYTFYAKTRFYVNGTTLWSVNSSNSVSAKTSARPATFNWTYAGCTADGTLVAGSNKSSNYRLYVSAAEWNALIQNVKDIYGYKGYSSYTPTMSNAISGTDMLASQFNQVKNAIGWLYDNNNPSTGIGITDKVADNSNIVYSDFNTLKGKLNAIT